MPSRFNPFDPDFARDPYPAYEELRREEPVARVRLGVRQGPVLLAGMVRALKRQGLLRPTLAYRFFRARRAHRRSLPPVAHRPGLRSRVYGIARYDDVSRVLRSPELYSSEVMGGSQPEVISAEGDIAPTSGALIAHDPPEHTRQRGIVNRGFTPRKIALLEPKIRSRAEALFEKLERKGACDLMAEFADLLPVSVIADQLGLDPERRDDFKRWSTALIVGSTQVEQGFASNFGLLREFREYMTEVIEERRKHPGEDLISTLIHSGEEESILSADQVISFATLMLAAGSETTTNLIGNAVLALLEHPEQLERVRCDPGLIPDVVEETLRFDSPIQLTMRISTQRSRIGDVDIPKGSILAALIGSANRDEAHFENADRFDIDRPDAGTHLAFGFGNHYCIGASLARLEGAIALEMILTRLRDLALAVPRVPRRGSFLVRGPSELPVRFTV